MSEGKYPGSNVCDIIVLNKKLDGLQAEHMSVYSVCITQTIGEFEDPLQKVAGKAILFYTCRE